MYDPSVVSYEQLLDVFWKKHDPTTLNRQGGDMGTQYRSGIYCHEEAQVDIAKKSLEAAQVRERSSDHFSGHAIQSFLLIAAVDLRSNPRSASLQNFQANFKNKIVTEIAMISKYAKAEEYHQQYLAKGGRNGLAQDPRKNCTDPIRCYG